MTLATLNFHIHQGGLAGHGLEGIKQLNSQIDCNCLKTTSKPQNSTCFAWHFFMAVKNIVVTFFDVGCWSCWAVWWSTFGPRVLFCPTAVYGLLLEMYSSSFFQKATLSCACHWSAFTGEGLNKYVSAPGYIQCVFFNQMKSTCHLKPWRHVKIASYKDSVQESWWRNSL